MSTKTANKTAGGVDVVDQGTLEGMGNQHNALLFHCLIRRGA